MWQHVAIAAEQCHKPPVDFVNTSCNIELCLICLCMHVQSLHSNTQGDNCGIGLLELCAAD